MIKRGNPTQSAGEFVNATGEDHLDLGNKQELYRKAEEDFQTFVDQFKLRYSNLGPSLLKRIYDQNSFTE